MTERNHVYEVPLNRIHADPQQPRKAFDPIALRELAESIKQHGLLQPIMVKPAADGFMIIHGERRYRAHQIAHKPTIKPIVTDIRTALEADHTSGTLQPLIDGIMNEEAT